MINRIRFGKPPTNRADIGKLEFSGFIYDINSDPMALSAKDHGRWIRVPPSDIFMLTVFNIRRLPQRENV